MQIFSCKWIDLLLIIFISRHHQSTTTIVLKRFDKLLDVASYCFFDVHVLIVNIVC